jgi:hypothetical protein
MYAVLKQLVFTFMQLLFCATNTPATPHKHVLLTGSRLCRTQNRGLIINMFSMNREAINYTWRNVGFHYVKVKYKMKFTTYVRLSDVQVHITQFYSGCKTLYKRRIYSTRTDSRQWFRCMDLRRNFSPWRDSDKEETLHTVDWQQSLYPLNLQSIGLQEIPVG